MYFPHLKRWRKELTITDSAPENPALAGVKDLIAQMADTLPVAFISSVDEEGFPCTKAMLAPRKREDIKVFYFTTNTFSLRAAHYKANPKASIYFCDAEGFKGMMLRGTMDVLTDAHSKEMIWREGDTQYYPGGVTDPNYCVLKFMAMDGRFYSDFYPRSFVIWVMKMTTSSLTILFEDPFWIGLFERFDELGLRVCKVTFGAEPTDKEVIEFVEEHWHQLQFSPEKQIRKHHLDCQQHWGIFQHECRH